MAAPIEVDCCFSVALFCPAYLLPYTIFENIWFHFFLFIDIYDLTWISREKKVLLGNPDLSSQSGFVLLCS